MISLAIRGHFSSCLVQCGKPWINTIEPLKRAINYVGSAPKNKRKVLTLEEKGDLPNMNCRSKSAAQLPTVSR